MRARTTEVLLLLNVVLWALTLGGILYETQVVVPAWTADLPRSVAVITEHGVIPGRFWAPLGLPHILLPLAALTLAWNQPQRRRWLLFAATLVVLIYVMQFAFFWPRNVRMGNAATPPDVVASTAADWVRMNWFRVGYIAAGFLATLRAFGLSRPDGSPANPHGQPRPV